MNSDSFKLNAEYAATFGAYWMIYAIAGSFASVFMLEKGYTNMQIGMTLAAANLIALTVQPFIADRMDRTRGTRIIDAIAGLTLVMMLTGAGFFVFRGGSFMLASVFALILAMHIALQPLLNSLAFRLSDRGVKVNYGIGRAGGSIGYSAILAVLGTLVEMRGVMAVPVCTEIACALLILLLLALKRSYSGLKKTSDMVSADAAEKAGSAAESERIDLRAFVSRNVQFFIMNLGVAGLFFSNSVLTSYMAQIVAGANGTTEQMGRILSLMAIAEVPTMIFFERIKRYFRSSTLIRIAALGFTAKIVIFWLADSVSWFFAAQIFQFVAFALIMPAMVYYINEIMSPGEAVKGQALFTMMMVISSIAASLVGGWILDAYGVKALTGIATLVTAAGAAVVFMSIGKVKSHR